MDKKLVNDKLVKESFSPEESEQLQKIHDFVISKICPDTHKHSYKALDKCYKTFALYTVDTITHQLLKDRNVMHIPFNEQWSAKDYVDSLSKEEFDLIWGIFITGPVFRDDSIDWISHYKKNLSLIYVKANSKYFEFIEAMAPKSNLQVAIRGRKNRAPYFYTNSKTRGTLSNNWEMFIKATNYPEYFNLKDPKVRLMVAIIMLSLQYEFEVVAASVAADK